MLKGISLKVKFVALVAVLFSAALFACVTWISLEADAQTEVELREQGRALARQSDAVWEFMSANQDRFEQIAYTDSGVYQGLHCAIAGRSIGTLFTQQTRYTIRYVNSNPRNPLDEPDEYEQEALESLLDGADEYYGMAEYDGEDTFRYIAPMTIDKNCLECHGSPAGELDVTGHPKEGWDLGDVGGAVSIVIPLDMYQGNATSKAVKSMAFFAVVLLLVLAIVYLAFAVLVTRPFEKIRSAFGRLEAGDMRTELHFTESSRDMTLLADGFNQMARELAEAHEGLEQQVSDRTAQLTKANQTLERQRLQLEEANRQLRSENKYKSEFLSMMSHELRTPLTSILAFSDMLNREGGECNEEEAQMRREIEANSHALLSMINDILELSRLEAGRAQPNMGIVDMGDLLLAVQSVTLPVAKKAEVETTFDVDEDVPLVDGDFDKLRHVLENLVGNAVKFTEAGGQVSVGVSYEAASDEVVVKVSDTGIGIAPKDLERVFEKFVQVDSSTSRKYGGAGIGLALVKEFVEMHGGSVAAQSVLGEGSEFSFRIPVRQSQTDNHEQGKEAEDDAKGHAD